MATLNEGSPHAVAADSVEHKETFGESYTLEPKSQHTHTAIVLHGRGSSGEDFAEEFLSSTLRDGSTLVDKLPSWRWVFPSSKERWNDIFQEVIPSWFEAHSLTDPTARQELQVEGLRESVEYVSRIMDEETERLGGVRQRLILGGISQGGAVGMWALLCQLDLEKRLGAFFAASTWLPFAADIQEYVASHEVVSERARPGSSGSEPRDAMLRLLPPATRFSLMDNTSNRTPVFIGHGTDDAYVDVGLGRQAANTLARAGWHVQWKEYTGAEEEGHWFKVPDEMDDIYDFLKREASS